MPASYDKAYRDLFSQPKIVTELLTEFIPAEITSLLDLTSLTHHSGQYITPLTTEKIQDVVWSVNLLQNNQPAEKIYLFLLLEFQSRDDKSMPLRMAYYTVSFYQQLIKQQNINLNTTQLPLVFPCVIYNGDKPWRTPNKMNCLLPKKIPSFLRKYQLSQEYFLIDEKRLNAQQLETSSSLLSSIFASEQSEDLAALEKVLQAIKQKILSYPPDQASRFADFISRWLNNHFIKSKIDLTLDKNTLLEELPMSLRDYMTQQLSLSRQEGAEANLYQNVINLRNNLSLTAEKIAEALQLPLEKIQQILNQEAKP